MGDALEKVGLYVSEQHNTISIIHPGVYGKTLDLRNTSQHFIDKNLEFHQLVHSFIERLAKTVESVEKEKFKTIGLRVLLNVLHTEKEALKRQYKNLMRENKQQLERLVEEEDDEQACRKE